LCTPASAGGAELRGNSSGGYPATQRSRRHLRPCPPAVRRPLHPSTTPRAAAATTTVAPASVPGRRRARLSTLASATRLRGPLGRHPARRPGLRALLRTNQTPAAGDPSTAAPPRAARRGAATSPLRSCDR